MRGPVKSEAVVYEEAQLGAVPSAEVNEKRDVVYNDRASLPFLKRPSPGRRSCWTGDP